MSKLVLVIPCGGIGKSFGTISREATYRVVEDLKKGKTDTICLSLLVIGNEEAKKLVESHPCISVDGCPYECSKRNLQLCGARLAASFRVVDLLRIHRDLRPKTVTFLDEDGMKLAEILAEDIALKADELHEFEEDCPR